MSSQKASGGKKSRKHGRNARKPATAKRKAQRPDLAYKVRNVLSQNGPEFFAAWMKRLEPAEFVIANRAYKRLSAA